MLIPPTKKYTLASRYKPLLSCSTFVLSPIVQKSGLNVNWMTHIHLRKMKTTIGNNGNKDEKVMTIILTFHFNQTHFY